MKITYLGHSALLVEAEGKSVIIDPFLTGNPNSEVKPADIRVDAVLLTHAHNDHFGDTIGIAKANDCPVVAPVELANYCMEQGVKTVGMNIGGSHQLEGIKVKYTLAFHSSSLTVDDKVIYGGEPAGILLTMGGKTLYHAGDTALFGDMKIIGELNNIDIAALPIGDFFTMGPEDALIAAKWVGAPKVLPLHYNTFPAIEQDVEAFCANLKEAGIEGIALQSKESLEV
ncbi:metal-dependent hydrolase [Saccharibacillus kuerlensis]|uniref:UPF0173 metal-dependent hydrolase GCM10010969_18910 n=1 Tax=Saccharibacillus kuerlensis TaxID=459527 RepID=A0ABQ2L0W7_9BACL|nr:metal-dependent hydrolase [Saccharibacillus kuerlensis]GGN99075.1 UPF0173 metal-dependent hydrolase [Saccharibacillus kuerlensis]